MFLQINILFIALKLCKTLEDGPHVCFNSSENKNVCCSDYEELDAKCVACNIGFTSDKGKQCRPCSGHFYGYQCVHECHCNEKTERCEHIHGCVVKEGLQSTQYEKTGGETTTTTKTSQFDHFISTTGLDKTVSVATVTSTVTGTDSKDRATDKNKEGSGVSAINIVIYIGAVAVLVIFFGICHFYNRRKMISLLKQSTLRVEQSATFNNQLNSVEVNEGVYHTIDDDVVLPLAEKHESPYLEVISGSTSSGSGSDMSDNVDAQNYLHSYHGFVKQEGDNHTYEKGEGISGNTREWLLRSDDENDKDVSCPISCQSLVKRTIYTTDVIVHKFPGSASESDDKKQHTCRSNYEKGTDTFEGITGKADTFYIDALSDIAKIELIGQENVPEGTHGYI